MIDRLLRVGITGGIGAGKSIVCSIFKVLGIPVYDADSRAKLLMNSNPPLISSIKTLFGEGAYCDGKINRTHIAKAAFSNPELLEKLNSLVHPEVGKDYTQWERNQVAPYTLKEAALLFESGSHKSLDKVILVTAPEELRIRRVLNRDSHRTEEDVKKIVAKQWNEHLKVDLSDFVIQNDGSQLVVAQVLKIHEMLLDKA